MYKMFLPILLVSLMACSPDSNHAISNNENYNKLYCRTISYVGKKSNSYDDFKKIRIIPDTKVVNSLLTSSVTILSIFNMESKSYNVKIYLNTFRRGIDTTGNRIEWHEENYLCDKNGNILEFSSRIEIASFLAKGGYYSQKEDFNYIGKDWFLDYDYNYDNSVY